jgi:hypothetical protein
MIGSAAFLAPEMRTSPASGTPPWISSLSMLACFRQAVHATPPVCSRNSVGLSTPLVRTSTPLLRTVDSPPELFTPPLQAVHATPPA